MLQTQRYGIQVSRDSRDKQTNRQTNQQTTIPAGRGTASGNKCHRLGSTTVVTTDRPLLFCGWHFWNSLVVRARLVVKIIDF